MKEKEKIIFIELTIKATESKVLFPLNSASAIVKSEDGTAFIETRVDNDGESVVFETVETYEEIKQIISKHFVLL